MSLVADLKALLAGQETLVGIGIDVELVGRFGEHTERGIFSPSELEHCAAAADRAECLAGRWCAKEAVVKALSSLVTIGLRDVQITSSASGRPIAVVPERVTDLGLAVLVSIAHTAGVAVAVAALVRTDSHGENSLPPSARGD